MSHLLYWSSVPGALKGNGFHLSTQAEQRLQLLVVQKAVWREVPHLHTTWTDVTITKLLFPM